MNLIKRSIPDSIWLFICFVLLAGAGCGGNRFSSGNANNSTTSAGGDRPGAVRTSEQNSGLDKTPIKGLSIGLMRGTVVHISDGDTFVVEDSDGTRTTVRIHAIDAPELSQAYGRESREALRALIANQQVEIKTQKTDRFKRVVGDVFLNGNDVGLEMLGSGNVWYYRQFQKEQTAGDRQGYSAAEEAARSSHRGLWRDDQPQPPWEYRKTHEARP